MASVSVRGNDDQAAAPIISFSSHGNRTVWQVSGLPCVIFLHRWRTKLDDQWRENKKLKTPKRIRRSSTHTRTRQSSILSPYFFNYFFIFSSSTFPNPYSIQRLCVHRKVYGLTHVLMQGHNALLPQQGGLYPIHSSISKFK